MAVHRPSYCYACGGLLKKKSVHGTKRLVCAQCQTITYRNSKPCVAALILDDYKVLLTRRGIAPYRNYWDIPGGFLDHGEHPEAGLRRELQEELGLTVEIVDLYGMFMDTYGKNGVATLNIIYLCKALHDPTKCADDVVAYQWFSIDQLPKKIAFKNTRAALQSLVERVQ